MLLVFSSGTWLFCAKYGFMVLLVSPVMGISTCCKLLSKFDASFVRRAVVLYERFEFH